MTPRFKRPPRWRPQHCLGGCPGSEADPRATPPVVAASCCVRVARNMGYMANMGLARDLEQALGRLLLRRNRSALYDAVLDAAPIGVDRQTYPVLSGLARLGPQSAARLADEVGVDRSGTSRYADRLEDAGLIQRSPDPHDGRATLLSLTPEGSKAVTALRASLTQHLAGKIEDWPDWQTQALIDGISMLVDSPQD